MTTSFGTGNTIQGQNIAEQATTQSFYRRNVPRGIPLEGRTFWTGPVGATNAVLTIPVEAPYTFVTGISTSLEIQVGANTITTINFDPRTYVASEIVTLLDSLLPDVAVLINSTTNLIEIHSIATGSTGTIRVITGNSVLGLTAGQQATGTDTISSKSPALVIAPENTDGIQADFIKCVSFLFTETLDIGSYCLAITSKNYKIYWGNLVPEDALTALISSGAKVQNLPDYKGESWYKVTYEFKTPLLIDGIEKDQLQVHLVDENSNIPTQGVTQGQMYVSAQGWRVFRQEL